MNPELLVRFIHIRSTIENLTEAEILEFSASLTTADVDAEDRAVIDDTKRFLGLLIFFRREVAERCMPKSERLSRMIASVRKNLPGLPIDRITSDVLR